MAAEAVHFTPAQPTHVTPISCPLCKGKAHLTRRSPAVTGDGKGEMRTFECEECHEQAQMFIRDESPAG
jgi:hypothetical protein